MAKQGKSKPRANGRPAKFSDEAVEKFLQAMRLCHDVETCASYAGLAPRTIHYWLADAREKGEQSTFYGFLQKVEEAKHSAKIRNVAIIEKAAEKDWKAAAWLLERRHWKEYARREYNSHEITGVERPLKDVSTDRLLELAKGKIEGDDQGE